MGLNLNPSEVIELHKAGIGQMLQKNQVASPMKKFYLDTERIVYRLIFGEGMVILAGCPG